MLPVPFAMPIKHMNSPSSAAIDPALLLIQRHHHQQQRLARSETRKELKCHFLHPASQIWHWLRFFNTGTVRARGATARLTSRCQDIQLKATNPRCRGACTALYALSAAPLSLLSNPGITSYDSWAQRGLTCDIGGVTTLDQGTKYKALLSFRVIVKAGFKL